MSRGRWVKPEFFKSLTIARLNPIVRLHFIGLWTYADDEGRGIDDCRLMAAEIWPLDDNVTKDVVEECQVTLENEGLIIRYQTERSQLFQIRNWHEHQHVPKAKASAFPPPDQWKEDVPKPYRTPTVPGQEQDGPSISSSSSSSESSREGLVLPPARRRDEAFETLCSVCNIDYRELTPAGRGAVNRALKEIRSVVDINTDLPAEIRIRARNYRSTYSHAVLTPSALGKHWAACASAAPTGTAGQLLAAAAQLRGEEDGPRFLGAAEETGLRLVGDSGDSTADSGEE